MTRVATRWLPGLAVLLTALLVGAAGPAQAAAGTAPAELQLAAIFGDHMVLQRGEPIRVWGSAAAADTVRVSLAGQQRHTRAGADGRWAVQLPALPAGGPHVLTVRAGRAGTRVLQDVLVGDVWLAAGQSNMEWDLASTDGGTADVVQADHPRIRHVKLPHRASLRPQADVPGGPQALAWQPARPDTAARFSAVAYHFARQVQAATGVPVGLVNVSWGGTHLETWLSPGAARADADLAAVVQALPADEAAFAAAYRARMDAQAQRWQGALPLQPPASPEAWADAALDDTNWPRLQAPRPWEEQGLPGFDGTLWLRRHVTLTPEQAAGPAQLALGMVDDCDEAWVNGQRVGGLCGWDTPRRHAVPAGVLKAGDNLVAVRVVDTGGGGGFHGRAQDMQLRTAAGDVPLAGPWQARVESSLAKLAPGANDAPTLAFNGMVQPLRGLRLRGVLWYQGESNVDRAARYGPAFRHFIADWRQHFGQPRLPFLYVQLAAFLPLERNTLTGSPWAELREAQRQALVLPHTGMAVATDVGDADDIHPRNKRAVGERLARLALRDVYGRRSTVADGPRLLSARPVQGAAGGHMELRFGAAEGGLQARGGGPLQGFAVADASRRFVPAQAERQGTRLRVWADGVAAPVAVRYGWVDNPSQANLVNGAGLPASPFRTDSWPLVTEGVVFAR